MDLKVNNDSTVSGEIVIAVSDSLGDLGSGTSNNGLGAGPLINQKAKGVTVMPYKEGGFTGQKFILDHTPLSALESEQNKEERLSIVRNDKHIRASGFLDLAMKDREIHGRN